MTDEQKLYELLKDFDPAVGERMEKHFRDGAFYFDLGGSSYPFFEGNTVYTVIPHFAEKGSEGIVKKIGRRLFCASPRRARRPYPARYARALP